MSTRRGSVRIVHAARADTSPAIPRSRRRKSTTLPSIPTLSAHTNGTHAGSAVSAESMSIREMYGEERISYQLTLHASDKSSLVSTNILSAPHRNWRGNILSAARALFLPCGYPSSVTSCYLEFQLFDTLQALCSYLRGMLCTHAVLIGMGVGESTASATSATLQWVLRDGIGMLVSMLFSWRCSVSFGQNIKGWRLFADCINDVGLTLELISPLFPREYFPVFLSAACICRSMCGVSSGATRAALMQHFALAGNVADLAAKEGNQETAVTLLGMVGGALLMHWLNGNQQATWILFTVLTIIHVYANWRAVTSLVLRTLNPQRVDILLTHYIRQIFPNDNPVGVLTPVQVAQQEHLFWLPTRSQTDSRCQQIRMGISMHQLIACSALARHVMQIQRMDGLEQRYILAPPTQPTHALGLILHAQCTDMDQLRALFHAHIYRALMTSEGASTAVDIPFVPWIRLQPLEARTLSLTTQERKLLQISAELTHKHWKPFVAHIQTAGWSLQHMALHADAWRCEW
jgi:hypothetical protein